MHPQWHENELLNNIQTHNRQDQEKKQKGKTENKKRQGAFNQLKKEIETTRLAYTHTHTHTVHCHHWQKTLYKRHYANIQLLLLNS